MKKILLLIVFLGGITLAANAQSNKQDTVVIKTNIYCDHCMECGSCSGNINMSLRKYPGIKNIKISPEANTITIVYKTNKTNPEKLRDMINEAGFEADGQKPTAEAVAKLDDCCRKQ